MAIASLILSILWIGGLGSLLGVIFGAVALSRINRSRGWVRGRGLAGTGLGIGVLGLLGTIALVAFLVGLVSAFSGASLRLGQTATLASPAADGIQRVTVEQFTESAPVTTRFSGASASPPAGKTFATIIARVCTGSSASQTGPDVTLFRLAFSQGETVAPAVVTARHPLTAFHSLPASTCATGSVTFEFLSGTRPVSVEWVPFPVGSPYRWTIPVGH